jgi:hypothetical protein
LWLYDFNKKNEGEIKMSTKENMNSNHWSANTAGGKVSFFTLVAVSLIMVLSLSGCGAGRIGSGTIVTEERSVNDFDSIFVRGEGTVYLKQGKEVSVVVETDDNLISRVYTEVRGRTLELRYASGPLGTHLRPTQGYNYHITVVDLDSVSIEGSAEVFADGVVTERLELEVTGSGQVDMDDLNVEEVWVDITGSGEITLSGAAETQAITLTGSGTFDGHDFEGKYVEVNSKGSGMVTVWATVDLDVSLAGEGEIRYYGDVVPDMSNGSGKVLSIDDN